jgi:hypothetical protein
MSNPDAGRAAVGRTQARQSRTKGKYGGHTQKEREERLRLGREAASNLIRGTIAKNQTTDSNNG